MRTCRRCAEARPLAQFGKLSKSPDGLNPWCKPCVTDYNREWRARATPGTLAAPGEKNRRHGQAAYQRRKQDPAWVARQQEAVRTRSLARMNLTIEQYDQLLESQGGVCALCEGAPGAKRLAVDHDHRCCDGDFSCGKCIRGLLCGPCNLGIGKLRDDPELLRRAADYVAGVLA